MVRGEEPSLYELLLELDRLEELREDLQERGLRTLEEVERRIAELHQRIDELEDAEPAP
ncbi:MAG TPA: hypothetical protein VFU72_12685 [Nitrolancea sp.]|nr:hypothetical protein [Nitrolancea sp.]